jgi:hypothetical protein
VVVGNSVSRESWWLVMSVAYKDILRTKEKKLLRHDEIVDFNENSIMPEFFEKSPLSKAKKHPDFQVTLWSSRRNIALSFRHALYSQDLFSFD